MAEKKKATKAVSGEISTGSSGTAVRTATARPPPIKSPMKPPSMLTGTTKTLTALLSAVAAVSLLVGGIGIMNIMLVSVTERTREIGVRKALGATRREILWQFLVESVTVTVVGGAIGILLASFFAWVLRTVTPVPAEVPLWAVAASLGMAAFAGIVFGMYPAAKAARLDPVESLRYE